MTGKMQSYFGIALLVHDHQCLLLSAARSLHYREVYEVFSAVTGGRPLSFSRRISGGNRSPEPFGLEPFDLELMAERLVEGNAEGVRIPR